MRATPASAGVTDGPTPIAVVGLGYWGPNLVRVLADRGDVELAWLCDLDAGRLATLARRYPGTRMTTSYDEVLADDGVRAVFLATPVFTHFDLASLGLRAGKHMFVEKPLAASSPAADELLRLADEVELTLMCGHTFLYSPPVRAVRALLDRGELGKVFFVSSSRVNLGLHQRDASVIWDLAPHDFSILLYWFDELPVKVRAEGRDSIVRGIADVAFVTLTFPSGLLASVELSWLAPSKLRRTVVVGSEKMVVYEDGAAEAIRIFDHGVVYRDPDTFGEYQLSYRTGDILSPRLDTIEPLAAEVGDFIASVRGERERIRDRVAADVVRLLEAAAASLEHGGAEDVRSAKVAGGLP
jgi:predicted dehydrogenase